MSVEAERLIEKFYFTARLCSTARLREEVQVSRFPRREFHFGLRSCPSLIQCPGRSKGILDGI